jgi:hypothetical protein
MRAWIPGLAALALLAGAAGADDWSHRYPVKGLPDVRVKTDDGSVRVETVEGASEVEARVTTEGYRIGPGEVEVVESQAGDRVDLEVRLPKQRSWLGVGTRSVRVELRVPRRTNLDVRTGDGSVEVRPLSGRIQIATGDGGITAEGLQGEIRLHTGDGSIRASGLDGRLEAGTGDGHMRIEGRFEALALRTGDGGIDAQVARGSRLDTPWSLTSGDGGITLRLPDDLGAELDAHTGDGGIHLDSPVTVTGTITKSRVRGTLGNGGQPLRIHTGDGAIRLQRL